MRAFDKEYYTDILYLWEEYISLCNDQIKVFIINIFCSYLFNRIFCKAKITQKSVKRLRKKAM